MKKCPYCQTINSESNTYCTNCSQPLDPDFAEKEIEKEKEAKKQKKKEARKLSRGCCAILEILIAAIIMTIVQLTLHPGALIIIITVPIALAISVVITNIFRK